MTAPMNQRSKTMPTTSIPTTNGVDVNRLTATVSAVQDLPTLGKFQFRAENRWLDGGHNRSVIKGFYGAGQEDTSRKTAFVLDNDEPDVLLGKDAGANPVEYVLHALAGCLTTTLVYHAAARNIRLTEVESRLEGELDVRGILNLGGARPGFQSIRVIMRVKGDASDEALRDLVEFVREHSPVMDILANPTPVTLELV
jgi:uncharacterized OsmC-like protein